MKQSEILKITITVICSLLKVQEKSPAQLQGVPLVFGFATHWLKNWGKNFAQQEQIAKWTNQVITLTHPKHS